MFIGISSIQCDTMRCDATDQLEGNARLVVVSGLRTGVLRVWWALAFVCLELGEEQRGATTKGVVAWRWRICKCKFSKMQVWKSSLRREEKRSESTVEMRSGGDRNSNGYSLPANKSTWVREASTWAWAWSRLPITTFCWGCSCQSAHEITNPWALTRVRSPKADFVCVYGSL